MTVQALLANKIEGSQSTKLVDLNAHDLGKGDVTVAVQWSTINYKDALALSDRAPIMQGYPLIGSIDFAGIVETSDSPVFKPGERVLVIGWELSQPHNGGYAQRVRVPADWLIPVPEVFSTREAMAIGTAGYTAMLCVLALEHGGLTPDRGDILVTGANGGVGSIAISILSALGCRVLASTGRISETAYLTSLGAAEILDRAELSAPGKSIAPERWAGAIDSVGSHTLANVLAQTKYGGVVAACGLAQGRDLPASVAPFILRNITLAGMDSVDTPKSVRLAAWSRLARDLNSAKLASTVTEVALPEVPDQAELQFRNGAMSRFAGIGAGAATSGRQG
ncbi:MDR family oxidoreductase [Croceicoccus sp. Ery5]|uniref:MDR family oxidoreductase n=1 Tax=Croceicoccus sp. Ery5 TaxID=1703340 RepID=UPI001E3BAAC3|nr:MDR family oxidoreductase [Croceicoccus sp. Ery5]